MTQMAMSSDTGNYEEDSSLFALATTVLRSRWRILKYMLVGGLIAGLAIWVSPPSYVATASFIPQSNDANKSGLATLAGQFGVSLPTGDESLSPDFYAQLLRSRVLLAPIASDTFAMPGNPTRRVAVPDLFGVSGGTARRKQERVVARLQDVVGSSVVASTGLVRVRAATRWPSVSLAIVTKLVEGVNTFNQKTRQSQASAERKFVENRLGVARADLRAAEDRLEFFLRTNRDISASPGASFERDRLQRDVTLQRELVNSLTQSLEDARIREVRDTPLITVVETPDVPSSAEPRHWLRTIVLGAVSGGFVGIGVALLSGLFVRRRKRGDPEAEEFGYALAEAKGQLLSPVRRFRPRVS